jgi:hypothetical protein
LIRGGSSGIYVLPVGLVAGEIQLSRQANGQVTSVVAVCLMVAWINVSLCIAGSWRDWDLTRANHVGLSARESLSLVEDLVILGAAIGLVERGDISRFLLLEPGIGVGDVTN